jgi:hypothetical protein
LLLQVCTVVNNHFGKAINSAKDCLVPKPAAATPNGAYDTPLKETAIHGDFYAASAPPPIFLFDCIDCHPLFGFAKTFHINTIP